jgi:CelD/BcsL family acetyltransferase involved in cellulose biosynthesis
VTLFELGDEASYEAEIGQCVGVTGYHRWFFLSALAEAFGMRMRAFAVDVGGQRLGVVPLLFRRRGPVSTANFLPVCGVGPVPRGETLRAGRVLELLQAVEPVLLRERTVVTKWSFAPGLLVNLGPLARRGFEVGQVETYAIPATKSVDDYLKGLAPKQRAAVLRGERRGLLAEASTREDITEWLPVWLSGGHLRQKVVSDYSLPAARSILERLADDPRMLWRSVRDPSGRLLAMNASIIDEDRLWGWLLAGEPVPGPSPHVAAYWDAIQWSLSRGLGCDFGSTPTSGIRGFKVAMGGELELSATAERVRPRAYRTARSLHAGLARWRAKRTWDRDDDQRPSRDTTMPVEWRSRSAAI